MNDAHVHEIQVQLCKPNTRGVTVFKRVLEGFVSYRSSESKLEEVAFFHWRERIPFL